MPNSIPEVNRKLAARAAMRAQIEKVEGRNRGAQSVRPFGIAEVDSRLTCGGVALGALPEIAGGGTAPQTNGGCAFGVGPFSGAIISWHCPA